MNNLTEFGKRIKVRRIELNMTQEELAKKAGYTSRSSINKIELGLVDLPQSKISLIASALSVSPAYLVGWTITNQGVNNGIIGNNNNHNVFGAHSDMPGEIESEIISLCKKMTMQQKNKLLTYSYNLLEENK